MSYPLISDRACRLIVNDDGAVCRLETADGEKIPLNEVVALSAAISKQQTITVTIPVKIVKPEPYNDFTSDT